MSALPPIADMCGATRDVRFVPIADIGPYLLDDFVGTPEQRRRHDEAERSLAVLRLIISSNLVGAWIGRPLH
jgi:hypothetical protein